MKKSTRKLTISGETVRVLRAQDCAALKCAGGGLLMDDGPTAGDCPKRDVVEAVEKS